MALYTAGDETHRIGSFSTRLVTTGNFVVIYTYITAAVYMARARKHFYTRNIFF